MTTENTGKGQTPAEADSQGHCALGDGSALSGLRETLKHSREMGHTAIAIMLQHDIEKLERQVLALGDALVAGLQIGDQCSRGYLGVFQAKANAALSGAGILPNGSDEPRGNQS